MQNKKSYEVRVARKSKAVPKTLEEKLNAFFCSLFSSNSEYSYHRESERFCAQKWQISDLTQCSNFIIYCNEDCLLITSFT